MKNPYEKKDEPNAKLTLRSEAERNGDSVQ